MAAFRGLWYRRARTPPEAVEQSSGIRKIDQATGRGHRVCLFWEASMKADTSRDYHERILRVLVFIQNHLDEALDLDALAGVANFSPYHFHRIFSAMVGESLLQHIRRLRLERAALRLTHSDAAVTRIAFEAGYETHEAFTRAFRAHFEASPSEYRTARRPARPEAHSQVYFDLQGVVASFQLAFSGELRMDVKTEKLPQMKVAFVRHTGPYTEVGSAWQRLMSWAGPRGMFGPATQLIGVYHDDPAVTAPEKLRSDACITVSDTVKPEGDVGVQTIGGGEYAVVRHTGSYEKLGETYGKLCGAWLPTSGRELRAAPPLEFYRNSPMNTPPEQLITDIYMPLA
jgi:AraC family transcriptional regulator